MKLSRQLGFTPLILAAAVFSAINLASCSSNVNDNGGGGGVRQTLTL
ncbi:MAG: hypothetical protein LBG72_03440 [Spirochaetaceae bacterium]|jgi:hypothetical protein|nr:hypothetical protein [Spirochaetaceae bacterium]